MIQNSTADLSRALRQALLHQQNMFSVELKAKDKQIAHLRHLLSQKHSSYDENNVATINTLRQQNIKRSKLLEQYLYCCEKLQRQNTELKDQNSTLIKEIKNQKNILEEAKANFINHQIRREEQINLLIAEKHSIMNRNKSRSANDSTFNESRFHSYNKNILEDKNTTNVKINNETNDNSISKDDKNTTKYTQNTTLSNKLPTKRVNITNKGAKQQIVEDMTQKKRCSVKIISKKYQLGKYPCLTLSRNPSRLL